MPIHRLESAAFTAATDLEPAAQRIPPARAAGAGPLGGLNGLPSRRTAPEQQGPLADLPTDLLGEVVKRSAVLDGPPQQAARQLATLKVVSKAFRATAGDVLRASPAHREAVTQTVRHAIKDAEDAWARSGWAPAEREAIGARLAQVLQHVDPVIVSLDQVGRPLHHQQPFDWSRLERSPLVVSLVLDALAAHPGPVAVEISAENAQLGRLAAWSAQRPALLRGLRVGLRHDRSAYHDEPEGQRIANATQVRSELATVLAGQTNLTTLTLQHPHGAMGGHTPMLLRSGGLDHAIASLTGLERLTLSNFQVSTDDAHALATTLRKLPALEHLDISLAALDAAAVGQVAASLPDLPRLLSLSLRGTSIAGAAAGGLAQVLPQLARLQALDLSTTELVASDMTPLAQGLAGMPHLQTLDLSHNRLDQDGRAQLFAALSHVPTLRHLHLRAFWHEKPPNLDTLKEDLAPLAGNQELHVYLRSLSPHDPQSKPSMDKVLADVPRVHFIE